jgi:WD40 repeat protein
MLLTAEGQALRLCDPTGRRGARDIPLLGADGTSALAASADGKTLFRSTPEGDVELVRLDGSPGSRFHAHDTRIVAMQVTADLHMLTAAQDGAVKGFDGRGGQFAIAVLRGQGRGCEAETLRSAAFSPDGTLALIGTVTGGPDCDDVRTSASLRLLQLPSGQVRWELRPAQVTSATFAPDGSVLVAATSHATDRSDPLPTTLVRLDARTGAPALAVPGHRAQVTSLRFSPDGAQLASGDASGTWKLWDLGSRTERLSTTLAAGAVLDLRFTPQGDVLLTQHEDDSVRSWRVADGRAAQLLVSPPTPDPAQSAPACAADRAKVAELMRPQPEGPLGVRDPTAWAGLQPLPELVVSSDGENVLAPVAEESCVSLLRSGCAIGCSRRYHLERVAVRTGRRLQTLPVDGELLGGCVPPGGAFVTRADRGGIQMRDADGQPLARAGARLGRIAACDATPDGKRMLLASGRLLAFWEAGKPSVRDAVSRRARVPGPVALSPRGEVSVDADGPELRLRSWPSGAIAGRLTLGLQDDAPTTTVFSPDGRLLAVGTAQGVVHLIRIGGPAATARRP